VPPDTATLGLTLQWTSISVAANIWHVLDVPAQSPADQAGLLPYSDYILGSPEGALHGESGLGELVEDYIGRALRLYVYNNEYDVTREVTIQPSRDWGGEGALGCVLGYGALHRLPGPLSEPVHAPGEMMFDGEKASVVGADSEGMFMPALATGPPMAQESGGPPATGGEFIVPAQIATSGPALSGGAPPVAARGKKKDRHGHGHGQKNLMDDYFKEEEKKSRELDNAPKSGRGTPLPPPPKGGPPRAKAESSPQEEGGGGIEGA
jgi:golgi reassembly-stacking protein